MEVLDRPTRRDRNKPVSTEKEIELQPRDLWGIFRPIYEHGQLSTNYLYEFTKAYSPSLYGLKGRLKDLFHEERTPHGGRYLRRMKEHPDLPDRNRFAIYDVTHYAEHALEEAGYKPLKRSFALDFDAHRFMISCSGASLELAVNEDPTLKWESRAAILSEAGHKTLRIPCAISHNGNKSDYGLIPDDLFGIAYSGSYWRLFALECDRGNEPYERADLDETSLHAKFLRYKHVVEKGIYKSHFGRKCGLLVLFVFTTTSKQEEFLRRVEHEWNGAPCSWLLAKTVPSFGKNLSIPDVMRGLLTEPWQRAGFPPIDISKPN